MNKTFSLVILGLMVISMLGAVSVSASDQGTLIGGTIYTDVNNNGNYDQSVDTPVNGAAVTVVCDGHSVSTTSSNGGIYGVSFSVSECNLGDLLSVSANKGSLSGSEPGEVTDHILNWNVGIVNVPMVPEFGLIVGITTVLGALGMFFVVRRK